MLTLIPVTSIVHDPDFWWHLRAGQLIVAHGGLLGTDPFTFTASTHHWTMHEWLFEVLLAGVVALGGLGAVVLVLSLVTWLGVLCLGFRARLRNPNRVMLGLGLLLAAVAGFPIWGPRVQMITFCFAAFTLLLTERHIARGGRAIWLLVPLYLVWSNLHSGFIIGLAFIALVVIAELAGRWFAFPDPAPGSRVKTLALVLAACTAVSLVNPNGPAILLYAFLTQSSPAQQSLIVEWASPNFQDLVLLPFGIMLLTLVALIVANRRLRARDAALVLATVALAMQSVRHVAIFIAAVTPIWVDQATLFAARRRARRRARTRRLPSLGFRVMTYVALMTALAVVFLAGRLAPAMRVQPNALVYAQDYPVCAARWLALAPEPLKIFNQYGEGGYLADQLSSRGDKIYIFGDAALMGDSLLYSYARIANQVQPGWDSALRNSGADIVLFDTGTPLASVLEASTRWVRVYQDPFSVAFVPADRLAQVKLAPVPTSYPAGDVCAQLKTSNLNPGAQNQ